MRLAQLPTLIVLFVASFCTARAQATWSIVMVDTETGEVAVGTVTCLTSFDLLAIVPVVVVGEGGAAVQASGDFSGIRRPVIFDGFANDLTLAQIWDQLDNIGGHQSRQYGIVDTSGDAITFTGSSTLDWAGGVTGSQGTMVYAIQGNILAGGCVVPAIETAILRTSGDFADKLMAGMVAARDTGGDGRCSCNQDPTDCGCPPASFTKSGHIGGMVIARIGDIDDAVCNANGCVDGDYFMRLNVAFQSSGSPDPVDQLQTQFNAWRATLDGRPDAVQSFVAFDPAIIPPNGTSTTTMTISLRDWSGAAAASPLQSILVEHSPESAGLSSIGPPVDHGDGTIDVVLTSGTSTGVDRFAITVDDGVRPVTLMPAPQLEYTQLGDLNGDGDVDTADLLELLAAWGPCPPPCPQDLDGDGTVGIADVLTLLAAWG